MSPEHIHVEGAILVHDQWHQKQRYRLSTLHSALLFLIFSVKILLTTTFMTELNKSLSAVITIAQTLLQTESTKSGVTPALVADKVRLAALTLGSSYPDGIDQSAACAELIRRFSYWIGKDSSLENSQGHEPWLVASRKKDWRYWQRYQSFLERKLAVDVVAALDESTDRILALMEDPRRTGSWDRRGLVVGHVQSGKTGSYAGLVCKAADAGYKVIIVLAGLHNNLRSQTQIRLEESFLGYETSANRDPGKLVGVAEIDSDPNIHPHCATTRANNGDFNTRVARNFAISPEERPWLFVVKKNKSVLTRLLKWIQGHVADTTDAATRRRIVTRLPLLVIDDEADNASVDTGEQLFNADGIPEDDHQPRAINGLIRKILHAFEKKAYVGYTATPFANIFIHRRNATTEEGHDLFPKSFIINLAAPSNYVGPARVFGLRTTEGRSGGLPLMRGVFDHVNQADSGGWMPPRHNKEHVPLYKGQETLPPSLDEAVASFVLATAARVCRGQGNEHSSMLIHVTRFVKVQHAVHGQVEATIKRMKQRLTRRIGHEELLCQLETLWNNDFVPVCADMARLVPEAGGMQKVPTWAEICAALPDVLSDIQVRMINGTARDALDYAEHGEKGLKVIAIGGDKLARGLTLEGLCTSYFVRTTKMYDTLMQMGRWFGYRPGYVDLCRLYTTPELVEWFGHIADASEELREEFDTMVMSGATPEQYGLKVESHPVLVVTSPLKMRSAQTLRLSYSGSFVQTISFDQSPVKTTVQCMHSHEVTFHISLNPKRVIFPVACGVRNSQCPKGTVERRRAAKRASRSAANTPPLGAGKFILIHGSNSRYTDSLNHFTQGVGCYSFHCGRAERRYGNKTLDQRANQVGLSLVLPTPLWPHSRTKSRNHGAGKSHWTHIRRSGNEDAQHCQH